MKGFDSRNPQDESGSEVEAVLVFLYDVGDRSRFVERHEDRPWRSKHVL